MSIPDTSYGIVVFVICDAIKQNESEVGNKNDFCYFWLFLLGYLFRLRFGVGISQKQYLRVPSHFS